MGEDQESRTIDICTMMKVEKPDVVCMQEVTDYSIDYIRRVFPPSCWYYAFKHPYINNSTSRAYGEVIITQNPHSDASWAVLPSTQGRVVTWVNFGGLSIGTGHLESFRENSDLRSSQMNLIAEKGSKWLWIGDCNMQKHETYSHDGVFEISGQHPTYFSNRFETGDYSDKYDRAFCKGVTVSFSKQISIPTLSDHDIIIVDLE
jgi:endonuclease/exonuclease/phosphatase family metal-dependent hydrolase